jgi:hypothetical protein
LKQNCCDKAKIVLFSFLKLMFGNLKIKEYSFIHYFLQNIGKGRLKNIKCNNCFTVTLRYDLDTSSSANLQKYLASINL